MRVRQASRQHERGASVIFVAALMLMLVSVVAMAVDVGRMMVSKNELQNAADMAALEGAKGFGSYFAPNAAQASAKANSAITTLNKVDKLALQSSDATITTGRWSGATGFVAAAPNLSPGVMPAIRVTLNRSSGQGTGPITTLFANVFGVASFNTSATAVGVLSGTFIEGSAAIPVAVDYCYAQLNWNFATKSPISGSSVVIKSAYADTSDNETDQCKSGQWTSLYSDVNDANAVKRIMTNGSSEDLQISKDIHIQPGKKASVYDDIEAVLNLPGNNGKIAGYVPVVVDSLATFGSNPSDSANNKVDLSAKSDKPTVAFLPFQVTGVSKSDNTLTGRFLTQAEAESLISEESVRNSLTNAPRLVQ